MFSYFYGDLEIAFCPPRAKGFLFAWLVFQHNKVMIQMLPADGDRKLYFLALCDTITTSHLQKKEKFCIWREKFG